MLIPQEERGSRITLKIYSTGKSGTVLRVWDGQVSRRATIEDVMGIMRAEIKLAIEKDREEICEMLEKATTESNSAEHFAVLVLEIITIIKQKPI